MHYYLFLPFSLVTFFILLLKSFRWAIKLHLPTNGDCVVAHGVDLFESIAFVIIITMIFSGFVVKCCELGG